MQTKSMRGITLLETVLYIGMLMVALPTMVSFVLQISQQDLLFDARTRMEQTAALVLNELQNTIAAADAIRTSTSTLGVNPSTVRLTDDNGDAVVIDCPTVAVTMPGGNTQNVRRLRMQTGTSAPVWITDGEIDVTKWHVSAVRDSANTLTGLRIEFDMAMIAPSATQRNATFTGDTTISLSPHTIEN